MITGFNASDVYAAPAISLPKGPIVQSSRKINSIRVCR
jgi:hypothetical protein